MSGLDRPVEYKLDGEKKSMFHRHMTLLVLLAVLGCARQPTSHVEDSAEYQNHDIFLFPEFHNRSAVAQAAWLGYGTGLVHVFNADHLPLHPGIIEPSFEQEAAARAFMVSVWVANLKDEREPLDPYLEDLRRVDQAGWLREYVWVFLHRPAWGSPSADLRLADFREWSALNLRDHSAQTLLGVGSSASTRTNSK